MTTEKRKAQLRESQRKARAKKRAEGRLNFTWMIKPEWRKAATEFFTRLEKESVLVKKERK